MNPVQLYKEGVPIKQIARDCRISPNTLYKLLRDEGVPFRRGVGNMLGNMLGRITVQEAIKWRRTGRPYSAIARMAGVSRQAVQQALSMRRADAPA